MDRTGRKPQWWGPFWDLVLAVLAIGAIVTVMAMWAILAADVPASAVQLFGTVTGLHQGQSEDPDPPQFVVRLDNGSTVIVHGTGQTLFLKGRRAKMFEETTRILGRKRDRFGGYLEEEGPSFFSQ